jgi:hypothetical protein
MVQAGIGLNILQATTMPIVADDAALAFAHRLWLTAANSATLRQAKPENLACHRAFV